MTNIYVGNLPYRSDERKLSEIFEAFGEVTSIRVLDGIAFVDYADEAGASKAVEEANNTDFEGRTIRVEIARSKPGDRRANMDSDACFICHERGHWARDCPDGRGRGRSRRRYYSRSRSRSRGRRYRSRSRSPYRRRRSYSRSRSRSPRRERRRSYSRSRSRSPKRHRD